MFSEKEKALDAVKQVFSVFPETKSKCAQYVYQLGKSFLTGEKPNKNDTGHGDCGSETYYEALKDLGYKETENIDIDKSSLISYIKEKDFPYGTILSYQAIDKIKASIVPSAYKYGHTQFYIGDGKWVTSVKDNYGCDFVYSNIPSQKWNYRVFLPPQNA